MEVEETPEVVDTPEEAVEETYEEPVSELREALDAAIEEHNPDEASEEASQGEAVQGKAAPTQDASTPEVSTPEPKHPAKTSKAPVGWDAQARKAWDAIPDEAKNAIAERERGVNMTLQQTADARKVAKAFSDVMTPHQATFQQMGFANPMQGLTQILQNLSTLKHGSPEQRAATTAGLIRDFGVDVEKLDDLLAQSGAPTANNTAHIEQLLDQRLRPVNNLMQQLEATKYQQAQQAQQAVATDVQSFIASKPHGAEVRMEMADILDLAASRGQNMSLDEAYDRACVMHPHIRESIVAQEREAQLTKAKQNTQAKRHAASSVSGNPAGGGAPRKANTIADALNEAWDLHSSNR